MGPARSEEPRGLTSRGASTRQRIVEATARLMYLKGVEATSLDDVRAAADVSKSQLYHYFSDKDALVREVIGAQAQLVLAAQQPSIDQIDSLAALRRWSDCVLALYRTTEGTGCPLGSLASELSNQSEPARELLVAAFGAWADRLAEGFSRMRARGELKPTALPRNLATAVLAAVQGGLLMAKTTRSEKPLAAALEMALTYVEGHRLAAGPTLRRTIRRNRRNE